MSVPLPPLLRVTTPATAGEFAASVSEHVPDGCGLGVLFIGGTVVFVGGGVLFTEGVGAGHRPTEAMFTFARLAKHSLSYVLPLSPQTGETVVGQDGILLVWSVAGGLFTKNIQLNPIISKIAPIRRAIFVDSFMQCSCFEHLLTLLLDFIVSYGFKYLIAC
jgi:hypothetical protein